MDCRLDELAFDIASSAGWYSAIAGVLAGFALLAVLLPLDHEADGDHERSSEPVVIMTCAFFSLLLLSFSYAILAGRIDQDDQALAAHEQLLLGASMGLSSLLLLLALYALLVTYGQNREVFRPARQVILVTTGFAGPLVVVALQFSNALDIERVRLAATESPECSFGGMPNGVWVNLAITLVALAVIGTLALARHRIPARVGAASAVARGVLGFTVVVVLWSALALPLLPSDVVSSPVFEHVTLLVTTLATTVVAATAWAAR
ncbi:MAG TPA: hypothetical protein VK866_06615 [Acidimicrobiales bacterium]|nr:hypothetical protein [Acidimicrobiales bacterium]